MNKIPFITLCVVVCLMCAASTGGAAVKDLFPQMEGWEPEGRTDVFTANNLFEYINGSAELYLTYGFKEMGVLSYFDDYGRNILVEIYDQGDVNGAYGIYSREKPRTANIVGVGAEGYYDPGVLNFFREQYYVKVQGFDLGDHDEAMITAVAKLVSQKIGGKKDFPPTLDCFPETALVRNSKRYIAKNFMGHGFLNSAYVAKYRIDESNTDGFIIVAKSAEDADAMLKAYLDLVEKNGGNAQQTAGIYRFDDPVSKSAGTINVKKKGSYIWGISTASESAATTYIMDVETNLKAKKLID